MSLLKSALSGWLRREQQPSPPAEVEEISFRYMGKSEQIVGTFGDAPIHEHILIDLFCADGEERRVLLRFDGTIPGEAPLSAASAGLTPAPGTAAFGIVTGGVRYVAHVPSIWLQPERKETASCT